jgi:hypothetical protein
VGRFLRYLREGPRLIHRLGTTCGEPCAERARAERGDAEMKLSPRHVRVKGCLRKTTQNCSGHLLRCAGEGYPKLSHPSLDCTTRLSYRLGEIVLAIIEIREDAVTCVVQRLKHLDVVVHRAYFPPGFFRQTLLEERA